MDQEIKMTKQDILTKTCNGLKKLYETQKNEGVLTVYIWGSILTDDFNPKISDVDTIAITEDGFPISKQTELKYLLSAFWNKIGFNIVYLSELNGGPIKTGLTRYVAPCFLLLDSPDWKFVAGKEFIRNDFSIPDINFSEATRALQNYSHERFYKKMQKGDDGEFKYFLKGLARLCYFMQCVELERFPFSYSAVLKNAERAVNRIDHVIPEPTSIAATYPIIRAINDIRSHNWDKKIFQSDLSLFLNFLEIKHFVDT